MSLSDVNPCKRLLKVLLADKYLTDTVRAQRVTAGCCSGCEYKYRHFLERDGQNKIFSWDENGIETYRRRIKHIVSIVCQVHTSVRTQSAHGLKRGWDNR